MKTTFNSTRRSLLAAAVLACAIAPGAFAAEISGVKFPDTAQVAELQVGSAKHTTVHAVVRLSTD